MAQKAMGQKDGVVLRRPADTVHPPGPAPGEARFLTTGQVYMNPGRLTWAYTGFSSVSVNCNPRVTNTLNSGRGTTPACGAMRAR